jgi:hypothetical protein
VLGDGFLHFGRADPVPGALDHVVFPGHKEDVAILIHVNGVAHLVPAVQHTLFLGLDESLIVHIWIPVKGTRGSLENHAAHVTRFAIVAGRIHNPDFHAGESFANGIGDRLRIHGV